MADKPSIFARLRRKKSSPNVTEQAFVGPRELQRIATAERVQKEEDDRYRRLRPDDVPEAVHEAKVSRLHRLNPKKSLKSLKNAFTKKEDSSFDNATPQDDDIPPITEAMIARLHLHESRSPPRSPEYQYVGRMRQEALPLTTASSPAPNHQSLADLPHPFRTGAVSPLPEVPVSARHPHRTGAVGPPPVDDRADTRINSVIPSLKRRLEREASAARRMLNIDPATGEPRPYRAVAEQTTTRRQH